MFLFHKVHSPIATFAFGLIFYIMLSLASAVGLNGILNYKKLDLVECGLIIIFFPAFLIVWHETFGIKKVIGEIIHHIR